MGVLSLELAGHKLLCRKAAARTISLAIGKLFPYQNLGSEFMPPLYEGDLLYMPTTFPGISPTKAREILQQTDQIIKSFPEVHHVFGKIGRAETATDPAPMDMIETTIMLKDEKEWPAVDIKDANGKTIAHRRRTVDELTDAMNAAVQFPGLNNAWTMPIKTRIDMLATGIKTPVGIKVAGPDLARTRAHRLRKSKRSCARCPARRASSAERVMGGNYIEFNINRDEIARYGLALGDVQEVLEVALGGMPLTTTVEGLEALHHQSALRSRFSRKPRSAAQIIVPTPTGAQIPLGQLATLKLVRAPMGIKSEGAVPNAWIYVDVKGIDIGTYVQMAQRAVNEAVANKRVIDAERLQHFLERPIRIHAARAATADDRRAAHAAHHRADHLSQHALASSKPPSSMLAVPFSLVGAFWLLYLAGYNLSVAVWIGIIALAGLDAETGVVMLLYLDLAYDQWTARRKDAQRCRFARRHLSRRSETRASESHDCRVIIAGLVPILWSHGAGADVMKRIATPMIGGVVTSTIMELLVFPAIFFIWRSRRLKDSAPDQLNAAVSCSVSKSHIDRVDYCVIASTGFRLHLYEDFARKRLQFISTKRDDYEN